MKYNHIDPEKQARGDRLRKLRNEAHITQARVSEILGIEPDAYGKYERGETSPSLDTIVKLAEVYHTTLDYLVCGIEPDPSAQFSEYMEKCPQDMQDALLKIVSIFIETATK